MNSKRTLLYLASAVVFFVFWVIWVFPYDALKSRIITEIENRSRGVFRLDVGEMDLSLFGSVTFKNLSIFERTKEGEVSLLKTPRMKIGFSPFSIFSNKVDFSYSIKGSKGDLEGEFRQDGEGMELSAEFDEYQLADLQYLSNKAKVPLKGTLNGEIRLQLSKADPNKNGGNIDIQFENLILEPTRLNLDPSSPDAVIEVPQIKLSGAEDSGIKGEVKKEDLVFQSISLKGGDIDLDLSGKVTMVGPSAKDYRMALQGSMKIVDSLVKALPFLFILEQQKTPEGVYPLNITGRLGKPSIRIGRFNVPL